MTQVTLKGHAVNTVGELPEIGASLPNFTLVKTDLSEVSLSDFSGKSLILNIFPSVDTGVCAAAARQFNERLSERADTAVLCISMDLPFAHNRFCETEGLQNIIPASGYRSHQFGDEYGVKLLDGPLQGLYARAIVVADAEHKVVYQEFVSEITDEPNYDAVMSAI